MALFRRTKTPYIPRHSPETIAAIRSTTCEMPIYDGHVMGQLNRVTPDNNDIEDRMDNDPNTRR